MNVEKLISNVWYPEKGKVNFYVMYSKWQNEENIKITLIKSQKVVFWFLINPANFCFHIKFHLTK